MNLEKLLEFSKLLTVFQKVERVPYVPGTSKRENDAEHSFRLALTAWYLISSHKLNLDRNKALQLALAHDLVETYAGDTYIYSKDQAHLDSKKEREKEAAERLAKEFPEFTDMHSSIQDYESRQTPEARFVYALDKILPIVTNMEDGGVEWREDSITIQMLVENKTPKVALSPEIEPYFNELVALMRDREEELFG